MNPSEGKMAHGGDRYRNKIQLDFSVNLNPLNTPECMITAMQKGIREAGFYPDPKQEAAKKAAADFYSEMSGLAIDPSRVIPGNGASELISATVHAICPREVLIPAPCFTGYLHACHSERKEGSIDTPAEGDGVPLSFMGSVPDRVKFYRTKEENGFTPDEELGIMIGPKTELLILTNPGNPAGGMIDPALLRRILQITRERRIPVLLDECFMEFTGRAEESGLSLLSEFPNLMVLRAFTKIFAMPGLRLGILFTADEGLRRKISAALPEWNLSCFAEAVLSAAAEESKGLKEYLKDTVQKTGRLREMMAGRLSEFGFTVYPSEANFLLVRGISEYREGLLNEGILTRNGEDMWPLTGAFTRLSVRPEEEQEVFFATLTKLMKEKERTKLWISRPN